MTDHPLPFIEHLTEAAAHLPGGPTAAALRQRGLDHWCALGLPGRRSEAFKYTRLDGLKDIGFHAAPLRDPHPAADIPAGDALTGDAHVVVMVNGRCSPHLSDLDRLPDGVKLDSLRAVLESEPESLDDLLGRQINTEHHPFAALNTGLLADGVVLTIAPGTTLERPIHLIHVGETADHALAVHPRVLVRLGQGSAATLLESRIGVGGAPCLMNSVTEILLEAEATLDHVSLLNLPEGFTSLALAGIDLGQKARYHGFIMGLGAGMARHETRIRLSGEQAHAGLDAAAVLAGNQHLDITTLIEHAVPQCTSTQTVKSVLDDSARGVVQGKVVVAPDAQKTDARQQFRALLLSPKAEADTKPELEIYADDVACAHGAATGALDAEQLFYLTSRGIDPRTARGLLIEGFLAEALERVPGGAHGPRDSLADLLARRLSGRLAATPDAEATP
ncbi:Fe-S cluster assembly protein SufD [Roseospirillum parvum]|uniref:Fe-S cluster assembly protein SufD n=1 Tax=Roseospirillum parvum TaxID=83401 RepID=A0A1G7UJN0_9PROT|nr:Fe-S cluster assembly protein SufD [Roseospirillum parvum]SDG47548.1 Fe-S cluster assembly protein SufD [Roseospirillum parvum]